MFYDFITKCREIFVVKMKEAFALQKLLRYFWQNICLFEILTFEILKKRELMRSLVCTTGPRSTYCFGSQLKLTRMVVQVQLVEPVQLFALVTYRNVKN